MRKAGHNPGTLTRNPYRVRVGEKEHEMYIMQSVHAQKVVSHMNKMYGDFGKFSESPKGNVKFTPIIEMSGHSQVATEIKVYASGYNSALDDAAELLNTLFLVISPLERLDKGQGLKSDGVTMGLVKDALAVAHAAIAKAEAL